MKDNAYVSSDRDFCTDIEKSASYINRRPAHDHARPKDSVIKDYSEPNRNKNDGLKPFTWGRKLYLNWKLNLVIFTWRPHIADVGKRFLDCRGAEDQKLTYSHDIMQQNFVAR